MNVTKLKNKSFPMRISNVNVISCGNRKEYIFRGAYFARISRPECAETRLLLNVYCRSKVSKSRHNVQTHYNRAKVRISKVRSARSLHTVSCVCSPAGGAFSACSSYYRLYNDPCKCTSHESHPPR